MIVRISVLRILCIFGIVKVNRALGNWVIRRGN